MTLVVRPAMTDSPDGSSGGTDVNKAFVDSLLDTVDDQCHSTTNPTLKPKAVTDEVKTARGNKASLNARLTVGMDADGNLTMPASFTALQTEVQTARGASPDLDTRLDAVDTLLAGAKGNKTTVAARMANTLDADGYINNPYSKTLKHTAGAGSFTGPAPVRVSIDTVGYQNSGAALTTMHTFTLPGNSLDEDGDFLRYRAWGTLANNANTKNLTFVFGATSVSVLANSTAAANICWQIEVLVIRTSATAQKIVVSATVSQIHGAGSTAEVQMTVPTTAAETMANAIVCKLNSQCTATGDLVQTVGLATVE